MIRVEVSPERRAELSAQYPGVRLTNSLEPILYDPAVAGVAIATPAETHIDFEREEGRGTCRACRRACRKVGQRVTLQGKRGLPFGAS